MRPLVHSLALLLLATSGSASAQLIRPGAATAGSTFSSLYDIGNAIDGSGMSVGFTLGSTHAVYAGGNHWTTANGAIAAGTAFAVFSFDSPQTLSQFHLWNHQSNGIASNAYYAITQFDLIFRDGGGNVLAQVLDIAALGGVGVNTAQSFAFATVSNVDSVLLRIDANSAPAGYSGVNYTGLAEIAFSASPIPEPQSVAMLMLGLAAIGAAVRRRRAPLSR